MSAALTLPPTEAALPALPEDGEPTPEWTAAVLGISLEEADWLLVLYRFASTDPASSPPCRYRCEAL